MNNNAAYIPVALPGKYYHMLGRPGLGFDMLVHGGEGSGKTTALLTMARELSKTADVLYVAAEEFGRGTLTKKLTELNINADTAPGLHISGSLKGQNIHEYDYVILDSLTHSKINLSLCEYQDLKEQNPGTTIFLVVQSTKDGGFRGSKEWAHEVDCKIGVANGVITVEKNRYYEKELGDIGKVGTQIPVFD